MNNRIDEMLDNNGLIRYYVEHIPRESERFQALREFLSSCYLCGGESATIGCLSLTDQLARLCPSPDEGNAVTLLHGLCPQCSAIPVDDLQDRAEGRLILKSMRLRVSKIQLQHAD